MDEGLTRRALIAGTAAAVGLPLAACATGSAATAMPSRHRLKVVVVGGHPDDPETMAGGTLARLVDAGAEVTCLYLTRGEAGVTGKSHEEAAALRTAEAHRACEALGARARFAGQVDGATEVNAARYDALCKLLEEEAPELVITHWPVDSHRDHRAASLLVYDAWLRLERRFTLYYGEVLTGIQTQAFSPTHYVDIASVEPRKRAAGALPRSQPSMAMYRLKTRSRFLMLKISASQMQMFQESSEQKFHARVMELLRKDHEPALTGLPDEILREMVASGIKRARGLGFTWQSSIMAFVALMFEIAPNFDEHPFIRRLLVESDIPVDERISLLASQVPDAIWREAEGLHDVSTWKLSINAQAILTQESGHE